MKIKTWNGSLFTQPSAYIPLLLSLAALSMVLLHFSIYGIGQQADEGFLAHTFQLLMIVQLPFVAYFIIKWLPNKPKQTLQIFAIQVILWASAIFAVIFFT